MENTASNFALQKKFYHEAVCKMIGIVSTGCNKVLDASKFKQRDDGWLGRYEKSIR